MATYDVLNEAAIAATPADIVAALLAEAAGRSHWWQPFLAMRQRGRRLVLEYFAGDFRGTEEWTLDPVDAGHTRIATRWTTDPQGMVRLLARLADVPGSYSTVMQEGFRGIDRFTAERKAGSQA